MPLSIVYANRSVNGTIRVARHREPGTCKLGTIRTSGSLDSPSIVSFGNDRLVLSIERFDLNPRCNSDGTLYVKGRIVPTIYIFTIPIKFQHITSYGV
jgi:hypothetical protein